MVETVVHRLPRCRDYTEAREVPLRRDETEYLEHVVSAEGVRQDPKEVDKLREYPVPTDKRAVLAFLGLASYYRRFVKDFARIAVPLHELTRNGAVFDWTSETDTAFARLKEALGAKVVLPFPDCARAFVVDCDASDVGMGAVLLEHVDGVERPIALESRKLTDAER